MLFFIPAWYYKNEWRENEQVWYHGRSETEFDDTVKQVQLFHRNHAYPYKIVLLSYAPNLRHFLHRQGVMRAPYWSCFDAIQSVRRKKPAIMSLYDLAWPDGIEFVFTPFSVVAFRNNEKYAQIEFSEYGNMIRVSLYREGILVRTNVYDDRGFVSSTIVWENGKKHTEHFLDENGKWKICVYSDGHVEVNPRNDTYLISLANDEEKIYYFKKKEYETISELIEEVFNTYLQSTKETDVFCVAMSSVHSKVIINSLANKKIILSFFKDRDYLKGDPLGVELVRCANDIVADSYDTKNRILTELGKEYYDIKEISPFDSRVDFGISQQLHVQNILVPIDRLENKQFEQIIEKLAAYLLTNEYGRVHLFTRKVLPDGGSSIRNKVQAILDKNGFKTEWAEALKFDKSENDLKDEEVQPRFIVDQCVDELSVSRCLREQRIVVDLQPTPDLFIQISCISMGIPQINTVETRYLEHNKNGQVCTCIGELPELVSFYLDNINNWNEAKIHSYNIGKQYTSAKLSEQWREVINRIEQD